MASMAVDRGTLRETEEAPASTGIPVTGLAPVQDDSLVGAELSLGLQYRVGTAGADEVSGGLPAGGNGAVARTLLSPAGGQLPLGSTTMLAVAGNEQMARFLAPPSGDRGPVEAPARVPVPLSPAAAQLPSLSPDLAAAGQAAFDAIRSAAARLSAQAGGAAAQARGELTAAYDGQIKATLAGTEAAVAAIAAAADQERSGLSTGDAERQRLATAYQAEATQVTAHVDGLRQEAAGRSEAEAARAVAESTQRAAAILAEAQTTPVDSDPGVARTQRGVAQQIAEQTADQCRQAGVQLATRIRQQTATHIATAYDQSLRQYLAGLDQAQAQTASVLGDSTGQAGTHIDRARQQATTAARTLGGNTVAALERERAAALAEVDAWETTTASGLESAGAHAREALAVSLADPDTSSGVDAAPPTLRSRADNAAGQAVTALADLYTALTGRLGEAVRGRCTAAEQAGAQVAQGLRAGAEGTAQELRGIAASLRESLAGGAAGGETQLASAAQRFRATTGETHTSFLSALAKAVDDGLAAANDLLARSRAETATATERVAAEHTGDTAQHTGDTAQHTGDTARHTGDTARQQHAGVLAAPDPGIWDRVSGWAADKYTRARAGLADALGQRLGGFVSGVLQGLAMAGVGVLLGLGIIALAGVSLIAALVAGAVVLLGGIALGIYSRFQEFYHDNAGQPAGFWRGLGLVGLGIADLTGIPYIIEGLVGRRAFGARLSPFEASERIGMGLAFIVTLVASAIKFLRQRPKAPKPVPEEPARGRVAAEVPYAQSRRKAVETVTQRLGVQREGQAEALGTAYDVAREYSAPFIVDIARRMLVDLKADVAARSDTVIVFVGRDGHSLAVATRALDPAFFQAHCREVVLSRALVETAVIDLERNAGRTFPQLANFRQAAGKVDPTAVRGALQTLTAYLQSNGVPVGRPGSAVTLVDTSLKGTVQELLAAIYPQTEFRGRYAFFGASPTDPHPGSKQGYVLHLEASESNNANLVPHLPEDPNLTFHSRDAVGTVEEVLHGPMSSPAGFGPGGLPAQRPQRLESLPSGLNPSRIRPEYAQPEVREGVKDISQIAIRDEAERIAAIRDAGGPWEEELARGAERYRDQVRLWVSRSPDVDPRFAALMDSFVRRSDRGAVTELANAIARAGLSEEQAAEIWRAYNGLTTLQERQEFAARRAQELGGQAQ
jgi:hypothetical protein